MKTKIKKLYFFILFLLCNITFGQAPDQDNLSGDGNPTDSTIDHWVHFMMVVLPFLVFWMFKKRIFKKEL